MSDFLEVFSQIKTYQVEDDSVQQKRVTAFNNKIKKISQECLILDKNRQELREELEQIRAKNIDLSIAKQVLMDKNGARNELFQAFEENFNLQRTLLDLLHSVKIEDFAKYHKFQREIRLKEHNEYCKKNNEKLETLYEEFNSLEYVKSLQEKIQKGKEAQEKLVKLEESLKIQEQEDMKCLEKEQGEMIFFILELAKGYFINKQFENELPMVDSEISSTEEIIVKQQDSINLAEAEINQLQKMCKEEESKKENELQLTLLSHIDVFKIPKNPVLKKRKLSESQPASERGVKHFLIDLKENSLPNEEFKIIHSELECPKTSNVELSQSNKEETEAEVSSRATEYQHTLLKKPLEYLTLTTKSQITDYNSTKENDNSKQQSESTVEQPKKNPPKIQIIENVVIVPPETQYAAVDISDISKESYNVEEIPISLDDTYSQEISSNSNNNQTLELSPTRDSENLHNRHEELRKTKKILLSPEAFEKLKQRSIEASPEKIIEILHESGNDKLKNTSEVESIFISEESLQVVGEETVITTVEKKAGIHHIDKSRKLSGKSKVKDSKQEKKKDFSFSNIFEEDFFNEPKPSKRKKPSGSRKDTNENTEGSEDHSMEHAKDAPKEIFDMEPTGSKKSKKSNKFAGDFEDFFSEMYNPCSDDDSTNFFIDFGANEDKSVEIGGASDFQLTPPTISSPSGSEGFVDSKEYSN